MAMTRPLHSPRREPYGHFSEDGREYVVTDPRTPRPWVNVVANPRAGFVVSQTGSGFSFLENSQLAVVTRWQQDLVEDLSGKFLYVKDAESGELWSLSPAPVWAPFDSFACRHGFGYTAFETARSGIEASWTLFCHADEAVEMWRVSLRNASARPRKLILCAYLEWGCGVAPSPRREFTKLFLETRFDAGRRAVVAQNHMWDVPSPRYGHWNTSFPYVSAFATSESVASAHGDKAAFVGRYASLRAPAALLGTGGVPAFGRHEDPIAALEVEVVLAPGESRPCGFALASSESEEAALALSSRFVEEAESRRALDAVTAGWRARLAAHRIETGDATFDAVVNDWTRYQAIAARLWGRCGYYQQSGAFGFRDQLQDSQVWLTIDPARCRDQIRLHAGHQFADGSVFHWWHPLTEQGLVTKMTDDLLWLAFVSANYVKETGDFSILADEAPFLDDEAPFPLKEHVERAFQRVFSRTSPRGIPLIGAGDWNDGLSAMGLLEKGESIWLGHFLAGLLARLGRDPPPHGRRRSGGGLLGAAGRARRGAQRARLGRELVPARDAGRRLRPRERREPRRQDLPQRPDVGDPERRRAARARGRVPRGPEGTPRHAGRSAPPRARVRPARPGDRLHHALRAGPARERRRLHARGDVGDRRGGEGEGRGARREAARRDEPREQGRGALRRRAVRPARATWTVPRRRTTAARAGPGTRARRHGSTGSSRNGSSGCARTGTASRSTPVFRRPGRARAWSGRGAGRRSRSRSRAAHPRAGARSRSRSTAFRSRRTFSRRRKEPAGSDASP